MKKSLKKLKEELSRLKTKAPRAGIIHTKIVPDKTKYSRKKFKKIEID